MCGLVMVVVKFKVIFVFAKKSLARSIILLCCNTVYALLLSSTASVNEVRSNPTLSHDCKCTVKFNWVLLPPTSPRIYDKYSSSLHTNVISEFCVILFWQQQTVGFRIHKQQQRFFYSWPPDLADWIVVSWDVGHRQKLFNLLPLPF